MIKVCLLIKQTQYSQKKCEGLSKGTAAQMKMKLECMPDKNEGKNLLDLPTEVLQSIYFRLSHQDRLYFR
jgi:hypothetical protein